MRRRRPYYCGRVSPAIAIIAAAIFLCIFVFYKIGPIIRSTAEMQAKTIATRAVNTAVEYALEECDTNYEKLAVITRNQQGEVTSVQTNMSGINEIGNVIIERVMEQTGEMSNQRIKIPLGTMVGGHILSGRGPEVSFFVIPTGSVQANIRNRFSSVGINQTSHQITLEMEIGVLGVLPGYRINTTVSSQICLAETVIVGTVPDYFTHIEGLTDDISGLVADYGADKNQVP